MTTHSHDFPTPREDLLREAVELARRVNRRLSERGDAAPTKSGRPSEPAPTEPSSEPPAAP
jgi:hypothetical protein